MDFVKVRHAAPLPLPVRTLADLFSSPSQFGVRAGVRAWNKSRGKHAQGIKPVDGVPMTRTQSRHESLYSNRTSVRLSPILPRARDSQTDDLALILLASQFLRRAQNSVGLGKKVSVSQAELQVRLPVSLSSFRCASTHRLIIVYLLHLQRFSSHQASASGAALRQ